MDKDESKTLQGNKVRFLKDSEMGRDKPRRNESANPSNNRGVNLPDTSIPAVTHANSIPLTPRSGIPVVGFFQFILIAVSPPLIAFCYLVYFAATQFESTAGITVVNSGQKASLHLPGGAADFVNSGNHVNDMLYQYLLSLDLFAKIDASVGLGGLWSKPSTDFVFAYRPANGEGNLRAYWRRKIRVQIETRNGLISLRVRAFTAADSRKILEEIINESESFIAAQNRFQLNEALSFARLELDRASNALHKVRSDLKKLRSQANSVDPRQDVQTQSGVLAELEKRLATALIELRLLKSSNIPESVQITRKQKMLDAIREQISVQKALGEENGNTNYSDLPTIIGEYERLEAELEFAESDYQTSRQFYFSSLAETSKKSRNLVRFVPIGTVQLAVFPDRFNPVVLTGVFSVLFWAISLLAIQSAKSR